MSLEWLTVSLLQEEAFKKREHQIHPSAQGTNKLFLQKLVKVERKQE